MPTKATNSKSQTLQPFSSLLIIDKKTLRILAASENIGPYFEFDTQNILKTDAKELFSKKIIQYLKSICQSNSDRAYTKAFIWKLPNNCQISATLTSYMVDGKYLYVEIENYLPKSEEVFVFDLERITNILSNKMAEKKLYSFIVKEILNLSKADLVSLFQLYADGSAKVVEQNHNHDMPDYLNKFFTMSQISKNMQDNLLQRPIRYLPSLENSEIKLLRGSKQSAFDLKMCIMKPASPVQKDFVIAMGASSATILALIVNDRLWGFIGCFNKSSHFLTIDTRKQMAIMADLFAHKIWQNEIEATSSYKHKIIKLSGMLTKKAKIYKSMNSLLRKWYPIIQKLIETVGIAYNINEQSWAVGEVLNNRAIKSLYEKHKNKDSSNIHLILPQELNKSTIKSKYIGAVILIIIDKEEDFYVALFRGNISKQREWALPVKNKSAISMMDKNRLQSLSANEMMACNQLEKVLKDAMHRNALKKQAFHDALTSLYNRNYLEDAYEKFYARAKRNKSAFSLAVVDIDYFKKINDNYSHVAGDKVLKEIAKILLEHFRSQDLVARYGGEEFVILLETELDNAVSRCESLRKAIEKTKIKISKSDEVSLTVSVGIANVDASGKQVSFKKAFKNADDKLYEAKENGRNQVQY